MDDDEVHLMYGHTGMVKAVSVSADGRWIASGSRDGTIRLWPMPEGRPILSLPREEFLERLRALCALRVSNMASQRQNIDPRSRRSLNPVPICVNLRWCDGICVHLCDLFAAHRAACLAGESPVPGICCLPG